MWRRGIKGSGRGWGNSINILGSGTIWEYRTLMERDVRNGKKCMHFVCDFNGRWLKDSSLLCCMAILLSEEGKIVDNIQI
jgi:hypothetical protein